MSVLGVDIGQVTLVFGLVQGLVYGLLAVGLVLAYRSSGVVNFAHGSVGSFGAAVMALVATRFGVPYWLALVFALALGGAVSAGIEATVVRRLAGTPRVMTVIGTLGAGAFLSILSLVVNDQAGAGTLYPKPAGLPSFGVQNLTLGPDRVGMLVLGPLAIAAVALFLARTRYGIAIRAAASNPDSAATIGVSPRRMALIAWGVGGALAVLTAALLIPTRGAAIGDAFGLDLVARGLAAAVFARMVSIPRAMVAGIGLGLVEQVVLLNASAQGAVDMVVLAVVVVGLLSQGALGSRGDETATWNAIEPWPPLPDELREVWWIRRLGLLAGVVAAVVLLPILAFAPSSATFTLTLMAATAIVGSSLTVVTGMLGQLTFGQFAVAGMGAAIGLKAMEATGGQLLVGLAVGAVVAALVAVVLALPAIRLPGMLLAVTTLAFALSSRWLFQRPLLFGAGITVPTPRILRLELATTRTYAVAAFVVLAVVLAFVARLRTSTWGLMLIALRDNEPGARAFTVRAVRTKLAVYAIGGAIAGIGGALYGGASTVVAQTDYPAELSVDVVALTVVGGLGLVAGPLLGALYIIGVPRFLPLDSAGLAATSVGWLLLLLYVPAGVAGLLRPVRERLIVTLARATGRDPNALVNPATEETVPNVDLADVSLPPLARVALAPGSPLLDVRGLARSYGGVRAVDGVDLAVAEGEIVGLIGPNGAGKTTLFELIGGFNRPDRGTITFAGRDVTGWAPEDRARHGLVRSFQDARLFPSLTVAQTIALAHQRVAPASPRDLFRPSAAGDVDERVGELLAVMGLTRYRSTPVRALSTGTRRICELACLVALQPRLLLLDEPSSGVAQRETEALGGVIRTMADMLDMTVVVIEHDIPLVRSLADRLVVMDTGTILASGDPATVLADDRVVTAYLGGDQVAIERSDTVTA